MPPTPTPVGHKTNAYVGQLRISDTTPPSLYTRCNQRRTATLDLIHPTNHWVVSVRSSTQLTTVVRQGVCLLACHQRCSSPVRGEASGRYAGKQEAASDAMPEGAATPLAMGKGGRVICLCGQTGRAKRVTVHQQAREFVLPLFLLGDR